jgi:hypothetical protein
LEITNNGTGSLDMFGCKIGKDTKYYEIKNHSHISP